MTEQTLIDRNILKLAAGGMRPIAEGKQSSTTRIGIRTYTLGSGLLVDGHQQLKIFIYRLEALRFGDLLPEHAQSEGYLHDRALKDKIRRFYPGIREADRVTHVRFYVDEAAPVEIIRGGRRGRHFG